MSDLPRGRLLIVDDDPDLRDGLAEVMEAEGYEVETAVDGSGALARLGDASATPPDCVLLDLMMPVVNGWQVLEAMRSAPRLRAVPVVVVTASAPPLPAVEDPVKCVLQKPFTVVRLAEAVARAAARAP